MRAIIGGILLLLITATSAYAECAWVLWLSFPSNESGEQRWNVVGVYSARDGAQDACERAAKEGSKGFTGRLRSYKHTCLPDTVDPRGPKGK